MVPLLDRWHSDLNSEETLNSMPFPVVSMPTHYVPSTTFAIVLMAILAPLKNIDILFNYDSFQIQIIFSECVYIIYNKDIINTYLNNTYT